MNRQLDDRVDRIALHILAACCVSAGGFAVWLCMDGHIFGCTLWTTLSLLCVLGADEVSDG